jgi:hypothetical protein
VNRGSETLLAVPVDQNAELAGLWGTSATDVFLAVQGALDNEIIPCRHNSMFWFDGQTFHQF